MSEVLECEVWRDEVQAIHDKLRKSGRFPLFKEILDNSNGQDFDTAVCEFKKLYPNIL